MNTTFVIPHKGRSEMLLKTLDSIAGQDGCDGQIEVVVVTKESALTLADALEGMNGDIPVHVLKVGANFTIAAQRNLGARQGVSDYLAFIDADIALASDWLTTMLSLLEEDHSRVIVSAMQQYSDMPTALETIRTDQANAATDSDLKHMPGSNLFMRHVHFEMVNGFPEHLETCEDYYFTGQVAEMGLLHNSSRSSFVHLGEDKYLTPMFVKEIWRGASNLQSIAGRSIDLDELPSFFVPIWVLLSVAGAGISLLSGSVTGFLIFVLAAMTPVVLYTFRMKWKLRCSVGLPCIAGFYLAYFLARGLGMCMGLAKILQGAASRLTGRRR